MGSWLGPGPPWADRCALGSRGRRNEAAIPARGGALRTAHFAASRAGPRARHREGPLNAGRQHVRWRDRNQPAGTALPAADRPSAGRLVPGNDEVRPVALLAPPEFAPDEDRIRGQAPQRDTKRRTQRAIAKLGPFRLSWIVAAGWAGKAVLALRVLRRLAGPLQTDLLPLLGARVPREHLGGLERWAKLLVEANERPGDPVPDRTDLTGDTSADDPHGDIKALQGTGQAQRHADLKLVLIA